MKHRRQTRKYGKKHTRRSRKVMKSRRGKRGGFQPGQLVRTLNEHVWQAGVDYLNEHPNATEYVVQENHPVPPNNMHWVFKVVRTANGYDYQTILNGQRVA